MEVAIPPVPPGYAPEQINIQQYMYHPFWFQSRTLVQDVGQGRSSTLAKDAAEHTDSELATSAKLTSGYFSKMDFFFLYCYTQILLLIFVFEKNICLLRGVLPVRSRVVKNYHILYLIRITRVGRRDAAPHNPQQRPLSFFCWSAKHLEACCLQETSIPFFLKKKWLKK